MEPDKTKDNKDGFLWRFRLKSFITPGITVVAMFLVPFLISLVTSWSYWRTFNIVIVSLLTLLILTILVQLLFIKPRAGQILLDAGPYPQWRLYVFIASLWLVAAVLDMDFSQGVRVFVQSQAFSLLLAAFYILLSFGRLRVYQRGIWLYTGLLPWHKIRSYRWIRGKLYFETRGIQFWTQSSCTMPEKHVEAFETYLLEHGVPDHTPDLVATA